MCRANDCAWDGSDLVEAGLYSPPPPALRPAWLSAAAARSLSHCAFSSLSCGYTFIYMYIYKLIDVCVRINKYMNITHSPRTPLHYISLLLLWKEAAVAEERGGEGRAGQGRHGLLL